MMTGNFKIFVLITGLLFFGLKSHAQKNPTDTNYLKQAVKYSEFFDFLQYDKNMLEWYQIDAIAPFFEKLKKSNKEKVVILHIGDSHIQSDIGTGITRAMLQQIFGFGGRGIVFPYQAAGTHSAFDYFAQSHGVWSASKNVELKPKMNIGISGITVFTTDSTAGFKLIFRKHYYSIQPDFKRIRIYCHKGKESFDAKIKAGGTNTWVDADCHSDSLPYVEVILPKASDTLTLVVNKTSPEQKYFECYGIEIQSVANSGIQYISVGINGAGYHSFFNQNLTSTQLKAVKPDLVIFDLGINDFFRGTFNYQYIMSSINKSIALFRESAPNAVFMLPNAQDIYYRGRNITNCKDYSMLTRLLSKEQNVVLYDYYNISGGPQSMLNWAKNGLSQRDRCHLSYKGYKVKGELYCNALLNSYIAYLSRYPDSLLVFNDHIDTTNFGNWVINKSTYYNRQEVAATDKIENYKNQTGGIKTSGQGTGQYYIVRSGDNLSTIAKRYGVTVSDLQKWNNLSSTRINAGQKLLVSKTAVKNTTTQNTTVQNTSTQQTSSGSKKVVYTIKSGDNLGSIAAKYKVSVDDIKKWNGLTSSNIVAGKTLVIYTAGTAQKTSTQTTTQQQTTQTQSNKLGTVHIVKSGESLWSIAKKYNTTVDKIKKDNKMTSDNLNVGQKLSIK
ncbi:MAG: hypothetical protein A2W93_10585 [Bacteroidetes bacterium GWF2_43_63]|nr:MAG: hypothetical protein A2W94_01885 [Bacteroidetes bacterium GWE2_42_42]OFY52965.1 MAG: hypothetical protein A2W93_10585 [Bacteroidetes bacterium GWF2_43_63]HBG70175.1 hypothetical protein [Bacteroidales bacterium]HCB62218.1 hypothetical protein [Bacteroidales bacterium]